MKKEGKTIQDLFQIPFHSLKSPKDYIQPDKFMRPYRVSQIMG